MPTFDFGTNVKALNAGLFISSGEGTHPTRTIDTYELIFVVAGTLEMFEDETHFKIPTGNTLLLYPGRCHGGLSDYLPDLSFYWLHFFVNPKGKSGNNLIKIPQVTQLRDTLRMTELLRRFLDDQESGIQDLLQADLILLQILREVELSSSHTISATGTALVNRADNYLKINWRKSVSTAEVAGKLGCNPDYLGRIYRAATGLTITQSIHLHRIRQARKLLLENQLNIDEIAGLCGYNDLPHFRRMFRRITGMTPSNYRELHLRVHINTE